MLCCGFTHLVEKSHRPQDTAEEMGNGGKEGTGRVGEREGGRREKRDMAVKKERRKRGGGKEGERIGRKEI